MAYTQTGRSIAIETALGQDVLLLQGFTGTEAISRPFRFELEAFSEKPPIDFDKIIGTNATISVKTADGGERYFNGIISRFGQRSSEKGVNAYTAEMVPWLWLLTRSADCRIFQNLSVTDIIAEMFKKRGFQDFVPRLKKTYPKREYCVQYRETDFNFVSRLMEQYGIFYFFEHQKGKHTLVLADAEGVHPGIPGPSQVRFQRTQVSVALDADVVTEWSVEHQLRAARYALNDFNFQTPRTSLAVGLDALHRPPGGHKSEMYDYPGEYDNTGHGEQAARLRIEEEEAGRILARGAGTCRQFTSGYRFNLTEYPRADVNQAYVLTEIAHVAYEPSYTTGPEGEPPSYQNTFACQPVTAVYRPARVTPRPVIQGVQTAIVVGPAGEEFWVDKYGRITVQFHWDRVGKRDEKSSCRIRVSQNWAGKRWGAVFLPRIGQEVIVEFLEGDPDAPIVTGSVYNGDQNPPYDLPAEQTKATIKSNSSKGGGGFNEWRFEDKKGAEQIFLHGERDLDVVIKNDRREWIGKDRHLMVVGDRMETVDKEQHLKVGSNRVEEIGGEQHLKVGADRSEDIGGQQSLKVGTNLVIDAGTAMSGKAGQEIYLNAGMKVVIEAGMQLTIKAGGGFINIDPSGVTIQGTLVRVNSGGSAASGSAKSAKTPKAPKAPKKAADKPPA